MALSQKLRGIGIVGSVNGEIIFKDSAAAWQRNQGINVPATASYVSAITHTVNNQQITKAILDNAHVGYSAVSLGA